MKKVKWFITVLAIVMTVTLCFAGCKQAATTQDEPTTNDAVTDTTETTETTEESTEETVEANPLSTDPVTINFWNGWTGNDGTLLDALVAFYNENNTDGVTVVMDRMQHTALAEKLAAALLSNTACEISIQQACSDYAKNKQTIPIDDIFDRTPMEKEDFVPGILEQCYYDGHLYGMPFQVSSTFLYWNKDLFEAAGLDPEAPPQTWDEMYEMGKQINDPDNNIFGGGFYLDGGMFLQTLAISNGGGFIGGSQEEGFKAMFTDPSTYDGNLASLQWMKKMLDEGITPPYRQDENVAMFLSGTCAMMTNGAWMVAGCKENNLNWGISLLPAGSKGRAQAGGPMSLVVFKTAEGRTLDAAYQFISYWNNNLTQTLQEQSPAMQWTVNLGYQPYLYSVANDPAYLEDPVAQITATYVDHYVTTTPVGFTSGFAYAFNICNPLIESLAVGKTPEEVLTSAQAQLEELLSEG